MEALRVRPGSRTPLKISNRRTAPCPLPLAHEVKKRPSSLRQYPGWLEVCEGTGRAGALRRGPRWRRRDCRRAGDRGDRGEGGFLGTHLLSRLEGCPGTVVRDDAQSRPVRDGLAVRELLEGLRARRGEGTFGEGRRATSPAFDGNSGSLTSTFSGFPPGSGTEYKKTALMTDATPAECPSDATKAREGRVTAHLHVVPDALVLAVEGLTGL